MATPGRRTDADTKRLAVSLALQGKTISFIAVECRLSRPTVRKIVSGLTSFQEFGQHGGMRKTGLVVLPERASGMS